MRKGGWWWGLCVESKLYCKIHGLLSCASFSWWFLHFTHDAVVRQMVCSLVGWESLQIFTLWRFQVVVSRIKNHSARPGISILCHAIMSPVTSMQCYYEFLGGQITISTAAPPSDCTGRIFPDWWQSSGEELLNMHNGVTDSEHLRTYL